MSEPIKIGSLYRHYKEGHRYMVLNVVKHTETQEDMVIYQREYGDKQIWARPLAMWNDIIPEDKVTEFGQYIRFREDYLKWWEAEDISP